MSFEERMEIMENLAECAGHFLVYDDYPAIGFLSREMCEDFIAQFGHLTPHRLKVTESKDGLGFDVALEDA